LLKFVITDYQFPTIAADQRIMQEAGGELAAFQCKSEDDVIAAAKDADALIVQWAPITRAVIENLPVCKVIVRYGIWVDNIDLEAARNRGIVVSNVPNYCIDEVADHTFALAMSLARQIINSLEAIHCRLYDAGRERFLGHISKEEMGVISSMHQLPLRFCARRRLNPSKNDGGPLATQLINSHASNPRGTTGHNRNLARESIRDRHSLIHCFPP
jgi:D-isomer specific 2-hydroxyacid dehydrogenase, catalytic domain